MHVRALIRGLILTLVFAALPAAAAEDNSATLAALRAAAVQGKPDAQYQLGVLYEFGYDFPDHATAAYVWYSRAAAQGNALAAKRRDLLKPRLSPAELAQAQKELKSPTPTPFTPSH